MSADLVDTEPQRISAYLMSEPSGLSKTFWRLSSSTSSSFSCRSLDVGCDVEMGAVTPHCLGWVSAMVTAAGCCGREGATCSERARPEVLRRAGWRKEQGSGQWLRDGDGGRYSRGPAMLVLAI